MLLISREEELLKKKFIYLVIYGPPIIFTFVHIFTSYYTGSADFRAGYGWIYEYSDNFMVNIATIWDYLSGLIGVLFLVKFFFKTKNIIERKQVVVLLFGTLIFPIVGSLMVLFIPSFTTNYLDFPISPISLHLIFTAYAIWKYDLFALNPFTAAEGIISTMSDVLILVNREKTIVGVNDALLHMLKYSKIDLVGKNMDILFLNKKDDLATLSGPYEKKLKENGILSDAETRFISKEGSSIPISLSCALVRNKNKELLGIVCIGRDITERKEHEMQLKYINQEILNTNMKLEEESAKSKAILLAIGEGLIVMDNEGKITLINKAFEDILGWKMHEILGKKVTELLPLRDENGVKVSNKPRLKPFLLTKGKDVKQIGESFIVETKNYYLQTKNKKLLPVTLITTPISFRWEIIGFVELIKVKKIMA